MTKRFKGGQTSSNKDPVLSTEVLECINNGYYTSKRRFVKMSNSYHRSILDDAF